MSKTEIINKRLHHLNEMGITVWQRPTAQIIVPEAIRLEEMQSEEVQEEPIVANDVAAAESVGDVAVNKMDWETLQKAISTCTKCPLHQSRTQTVFGVGTRKPQLMIIGEAPGAQEDKQGEPFVGRAGKLLDAMLRAIGLHRNDIFIANILKCRPPNNRDPQIGEVNTCTTYLEQQIALLQPKLVLAVGRIAAHHLLNSTEPLSRLRGRRFNYGRKHSVPLFVTYHPAYLLRSPRDKGKAYEDLLIVKKMLASVED